MMFLKVDSFLCSPCPVRDLTYIAALSDLEDVLVTVPSLT